MRALLQALAVAAVLQLIPVQAGAQAPAPAQGAAATATAPAVKKARQPRGERTPESLACSTQADQKGLKGAERKKFRRSCITAARKKA